ncbi:hypothetical protein LN042_11315 [Kitasatospora sp. RB6PN24]|uniref:hypothetical protein n=1 Tax=Kitasatospora humi TaxID=2893891 RepID=UPI001E5172B0|nr:hypothetical protein [Kitasatospora humi]MCC9307684.1 hypothetical protein [Kitasatospora humi]
MSTADAVDREVAWLNTSVNDGLPLLPASAGGPWQNIQAYRARTPGRKSTNIFVLRSHTHLRRTANARRMPTYEFHLKVVWPLTSGAGSAETDQRALDAAIDKLLQRIDGQLGDKSHGGRFLSVAENPDNVTVTYEDPEQTLPMGEFHAEVVYYADDTEITN